MTPRMRPLQLDFRRTPTSRLRWLGWGALGAALLCGVAVFELYTDSARRHDIAKNGRDRLAEQLRVVQPRRAAETVDVQTLADVKRANAVIDQLTVPWDALFAAVEAADTRSLALLSLTPNARDRTLRLGGEARTIDAVLAYVDKLAAQPLLGQVHLLGYAPVVRDGVSVVGFTLAATWRQAE